MSWLAMQSSHGLLCLMPCLIGDQLGQLQRELCFLTSSGWSVPSIQPTLLHPHQSPCLSVYTISQQVFIVLITCAELTCRGAVSWRSAPYVYLVYSSSYCSEVIDTFSAADHNDDGVIRSSVKQWGLLFLLSDGQPCGNHYIFTVFILSQADWIITYSSFVQRHYCIMQMLIVIAWVL